MASQLWFVDAATDAPHAISGVPRPLPQAAPARQADTNNPEARDAGKQWGRVLAAPKAVIFVTSLLVESALQRGAHRRTGSLAGRSTQRLLVLSSVTCKSRRADRLRVAHDETSVHARIKEAAREGSRIDMLYLRLIYPCRA